MDPSAQDQQADRIVGLAVDLVNLRTRLKESPLDAAGLRQRGPDGRLPRPPPRPDRWPRDGSGQRARAATTGHGSLNR
jgi:hypothetical protein